MELRVESRCSQLAYGFLRGKAYADMEFLAYSSPDWSRIENIVNRFSQDDSRLVTQSFAEWKDTAAEWQKNHSIAVLAQKKAEADERAAAKEAAAVK